MIENSLIQEAIIGVTVIGAAIIISLIAGILLKDCIFEKAFEKLDDSRPKGIPEEEWKRIRDIDVPTGKIHGFLERIFFMAVFWYNQPIVIGFWMAFKIAAKYEAWSNVVKMPSEFKRVNERDYFRARRHWGTRIYQGLAIGMLYDLIVALMFTAVAKTIIWRVQNWIYWH